MSAPKRHAVDDGTGTPALKSDHKTGEEQGTTAAVSEEQVLAFIHGSASPVVKRVAAGCELRLQRLAADEIEATIRRKYGAKLDALGMSVHVVSRSESRADYHMVTSLMVQVSLKRPCTLSSNTPHVHLVERWYNGDNGGSGTTGIAVDDQQVGTDDEFVYGEDKTAHCFTVEEAEALNSLLGQFSW